MITHYINLNVRSSNPVDTGISLTQGDYGHVRFVMTVKDGNSDLDGVVSAEITFETPNGCGVNGEVTVENNDYIYVIKGNELQAAGKVYAVLTMTFSDGRVSSCGFVFECRRHPSSNIDAGSYITKIEELIAQATKALNSADGAAALADMAKIAAIAAKNAAELAANNASAVTGVEIATIDKAGLVKPDGSSIEVDIDGTIRSSGVKIATYEKAGLTKPDGDTLGIDEDGVIKVIMTASGLKTKDTNGLIGEENAEVMLQALIDDITNRVVNQILTKTMLVNNALTTVSGQYPADAAYLKTLKDLIDNLTTAVSKLNSDMLWKDVTDEFTFASDLTLPSSYKKVYYNPATKRIVFNISGSCNTTLGTIRDIATFPSKYYPKVEIFGALYGFVSTSDSTYYYEARVYRSKNGIRIIPNVTKTGAQIRINISWICD